MALCPLGLLRAAPEIPSLQMRTIVAPILTHGVSFHRFRGADLQRLAAGEKATAKKLTPEQRSESARKAARARWKREKAKQPFPKS